MDADDGNRRTARNRGFIFTVNNYTEEDEHRIFDLAHHAQYVIAGRETAPTTGTPHLQGFVYFTNPRTFQAVCEMLPQGAHVERKSRYSTFTECSDYCKKDGDYFEEGTLPLDATAAGEKGAKERWELAKQGRFEELPPENYPRYRAIYFEFKQVDDRNELTNYWVCGKSGCGKSRYIRETYGRGTTLGGTLGFYSKPMSKWWDGYNGQDVVLLDDFDPKHGEYLAYYLKIWSDHYAFQAEVKGGMINIRPKIIVVTSQYKLEDCFTSVQDRAALLRRFEINKLADYDEVPEVIKF